MAKMFSLILLVIFTGVLPAHAFQQPEYSRADSLLADSVLSLTYKNQGLYTLYDDLKPISSVARFEIDFNKLERVCAWLSQDSVFLFLPLRNDSPPGRGMVSIMAVNQERFKKELAGNPEFWSSKGLDPTQCPSVVLAEIETYDVSNRHRAFGYLYGYPHYAVSFFVEAHESLYQAGVELPRSFFTIPVYSGMEGKFIYAYPGDQQPREEDLELLEKAETVLEEFRAGFEPFREDNPDMPFLKWYFDNQ